MMLDSGHQVENDMIRRRNASKATMARFEMKPFSWKTASTCIHLARFHAANMGHDVPLVPRFRSPLGARRALQATGHDSLASLLDSLFPVIIPAMMVLGDLAMLPGDEDDGMGAILIHGGGRVLMGWHGTEADRITPIAEAMGAVTRAWRL